MPASSTWCGVLFLRHRAIVDDAYCGTRRRATACLGHIHTDAGPPSWSTQLLFEAAAFSRAVHAARVYRGAGARRAGSTGNRGGSGHPRRDSNASIATPPAASRASRWLFRRPRRLCDETSATSHSSAACGPGRRVLGRCHAGHQSATAAPPSNRKAANATHKAVVILGEAVVRYEAGGSQPLPGTPPRQHRSAVHRWATAAGESWRRQHTSPHASTSQVDSGWRQRSAWKEALPRAQWAPRLQEGRRDAVAVCRADICGKPAAG